MIFHRYKNPLFNYALRILGNRADAEDTLSDVFLVLFEKKYQPAANAKFSTWLYTVTRNSCIDKIRKRKKFVAMWFTNEETRELKPLEMPACENPPGETLQKEETARYIRRALNKLPFLQKEALVLREYQQLSYEEIAQVLNCSLEKVKILIFRARKALKENIPSFILKEETP